MSVRKTVESHFYIKLNFNKKYNTQKSNSTEQSPYQEANNSCSASQEIPHILWNPKLCYQIPCTKSEEQYKVEVVTILSS
jgi:hypothetical protein